jgi:putative oxidoreductase
MSTIVLIGRILFCYLFVTAAIGHLTKTKMMAGYAGSKGVPAPGPATFFTGLMLAAGSIMVLLGAWADLGSLILAAFLLPTAVIMHAYWKETDPGARQMEEIQFKKDTALGGASLMLFALLSFAGGQLDLTLTGPLFHLT